jgi:hypothetical protein
MTIGLQFKNADGDILIDSDYHHFHFVGIATYVDTVRLPALLGGNNTSHSYTGATGLSDTQINGDIIKYRISTAPNSSVPPIAFIKPSYTGTGAPFAGIVLTQQVSTAEWEFWVLQDYGYLRPSLYCFNRIDQMTSSQQTVPESINQGIATFNSAEQKTYDTRFKPLKVVGTSNTTAPSLARPSVSSNYNPDFTPTNVNSVDYSVTSGGVDDLMYYAPSLAHSCQSVTASTGGDGFQASGYNSYFYAWARADIWWCFYRNTFRLTSVSQMESRYSIYASGHVYKSQEDKSSIFNLTTILVGLFTFGAGLPLLLGGIALSLAVTQSFADAGVVSGVYFPYENSSRNADQTQPVIFSRASFYGTESGITYEDTNQYDDANILQPGDSGYIDSLTFEYDSSESNKTWIQAIPAGSLYTGSAALFQVYYENTQIFIGEYNETDTPTIFLEDPYYDVGSYRYYVGQYQETAAPDYQRYAVARVLL